MATDLSAARVEYRRAVGQAIRDETATAWEHIEHHRQATAEADGLIAEDLLDDYVRQSLTDLAAVRDAATESMKNILAAGNASGLIPSVREIAKVVGASHSTVLRWIAAVDAAEDQK